MRSAHLILNNYSAAIQLQKPTLHSSIIVAAGTVMNTLRSRLLVAASAVAITWNSLASADPYDHHGHDDHYGHGDRHYYHEYPHWREGHWYHGDHSGHLGWWWIAGSMWYFYPAPVYPYPSPYVPPVVVEQQPAAVTAVPPPATVWYYCNSSRNYYPYVSVCPEGWQAVPAQPNDAPMR